MKLIQLLEAGTDKTAILKLQQEVLDLLSDDDIDIDIEGHPMRQGTWRLRCTHQRVKGSIVVALDTQVTEGFCNYIVAMLLKKRLEELGFDNKTCGRYFLKRSDGREYSGLLLIDPKAEDDSIPFKIIARHRAIGLRGQQTVAVYSVASVYSYKGLDDALKYLNTLDTSFLDSRDQNAQAEAARNSSLTFK